MNMSEVNIKTDTPFQESILSIFPEEVWEYMLNRLQFSTDVYSVILAFPELSSCFHNKKVNWLFVQVLPHLMTKHLLDRRINKCPFPISTWKHSLNKELSKLRLVSKEWKHAVDFSLVNHADRNILSPTEYHQNQAVLVPKNTFSYNEMANFHFGATVFRTGQEVDTFIQQMCAHLGNPFPGKSVYIRPLVSHHLFTLVENCVELFEKFGKYVHVLEIEMACIESCFNLELYKNILQCISHTKNLTTLTFTGIHNCDNGEAGYYFSEPANLKLFPELPNLQTFHWRVNCKPENSIWTTHMIYTYGRAVGIRKLGIDQLAAMMPYFTSRLSGLTELHLQLANVKEAWNISVIGTILKKLPSNRQLQTFSLSDTKYFHPIINITHLLNELDGFELQNVILEDVKLEEKVKTLFSHAFRSTATVLLTIKSLYLHDNLKLTYEFLQMVPNLEIVHIYFDEEATENVYEDYKLKSLPKRTLATKLKTYFQVGGFPDKIWFPMATRLRGCLLGAHFNDPCVFDNLESIWMELPNLKMLIGSVEVKVCKDKHHFVIRDVRFARECKNQVFLDSKPNWVGDKETL